MLFCPKDDANPPDGIQWNGKVGFQVFAKTGYENIHASPQEIIIFPPEVLQYLFPFHDLVFMFHEVFEEFSFLKGHLVLLFKARQSQFIEPEFEASYTGRLGPNPAWAM